jgi:hypothetical protein
MKNIFFLGKSDQKTKGIVNIIYFMKGNNSKIYFYCITFVLVILFFFIDFDLASLSTYGSSDDTVIRVNLQLEVDGDIPSCEKVVVENQERNIDCHDMFYGDGPFSDTHTISFDLPKNMSIHSQNYEACLIGSSEEILSCNTIKKASNANRTSDITFRFTANGIEVDNSTSTTRNQNSNSFILNAIFLNEKGKPCPDLELYINHPKLADDKTHIDCEKMFYGFTPFKQIHTIEKIIPAGIINEGEVFEVCLDYSYGRTCDLVQNEIEDNSEFIVFDLLKIIR